MANYNKGKIAIPSVTGNLVINISAVQSTPPRKWTKEWYFYPTDNGVGSHYKSIASLAPVYQYPNKACEAIKGDTIVITADVSKLEKVDILELYPLTTLTDTDFDGIIIKKATITASEFVNNTYTYTSSENNCAGIGFRFKATSESVGQELASSISFEG